MLAGEGLHPTSKAVRVRFEGDKRTVIDGPFTESKELIAGYWLWQVRDMDEAIEWIKRAPFDGGTQIEIRPVFEEEDFGDEFTPELREQEQPAARPDRGAAVVATGSDTNRAIETVWRIESARLIAGLTRIVRDVGLAEELSQDALVAALEQWPESGVPDNPGAWLMATAKHRAIDLLRRSSTLERKQEELAREIELQLGSAQRDIDAELDDHVGDDLLRLIFMACHPVLSTQARAALTLRLLGGLTTDEIARAFLVPEPTVAQRIVRAKRTLAEARIAFEDPSREELAERLSSVLEVIYLIFNEGYSATAGDDWLRPALCEEALRLGASWPAWLRRSPRCTASWR